ncbi:MAG TPA: bacteriocin [Candidatus Obscuribacterales bacterium]
MERTEEYDDLSLFETMNADEMKEIIGGGKKGKGAKIQCFVGPEDDNGVNPKKGQS